MKLIKTILAALTVIIGFSSNAQENNTTEIKRTPIKRELKAELKVIEFQLTPEQIANKRANELNVKVELTEEQLTKVKDLFLKVENRKNALNNTNSSEEEKTNALNDLQKMEDDGLQSILTPTQKKIISTPKTTKTATNM